MRFQILPYSKGSHNELNYVPLNLYIEALTPSVIALVFEDGNLEVSRLRWSHDSGHHGGIVSLIGRNNRALPSSHILFLSPSFLSFYLSLHYCESNQKLIMVVTWCRTSSKPPELWEYTFLLSKPPTLGYFLWKPEKTKMAPLI